MVALSPHCRKDHEARQVPAPVWAPIGPDSAQPTPVDYRIDGIAYLYGEQERLQPESACKTEMLGREVVADADRGGNA